MASRSDKLHQRRKALSKSDLGRKTPTREPNKRILIVSEGKATEPNYFEAFRVFAKLVNVDVDVCGKECNSAPISVVDFAEKKANGAGHFNSGGYDNVYCVFDRDTHETFEKAISKVYSLNKSNKFLAGKIEAVVSYPCFEVWILFHFVYTRSPFAPVGSRSAADMVSSALRDATPIFHGYEKAISTSQCARLFSLFDTAVKNAENANSDKALTGEANPSTSIHEMLKKIMSANKGT
ncbi:RloB family protein [Maritalea sp.]|uniref:RloB family protein n=1 Tax=Maritalea sp. TaxID=2003361 RepID=UPI003EF5790B